MKLHELPDDFTGDQIRELDRDGLDALPYSILAWECCVQGCTGGTAVRDYGLAPWFLLHRNSKAFDRNPGKFWVKCDRTVWLCSKHNKQYKQDGAIKFFRNTDHSLNPPVKILKQVNTNIEIINDGKTGI